MMKIRGSLYTMQISFKKKLLLTFRPNALVASEAKVLKMTRADDLSPKDNLEHLVERSVKVVSL